MFYGKNTSIAPLNVIDEDDRPEPIINRKKISRLTTRVVKETGDNKLYEQLYISFYENFLRAETKGKCIYGINSFGCFTLQSTLQGAAEFAQSVKGEEILADAKEDLAFAKSLTPDN